MNSNIGDSNIVLFMSSITLIIYGYLLVFRKRTILLPWERWAIILLRKIYGEKTAEAREIELISPKRLRRNGLIALILGITCLTIVILPIIM